MLTDRRSTLAQNAVAPGRADAAPDRCLQARSLPQQLARSARRRRCALTRGPPADLRQNSWNLSDRAALRTTDDLDLTRLRARSRITARSDGVCSGPGPARHPASLERARPESSGCLAPPARRSNTPGIIAASRRRQTRPATRQFRALILQRALSGRLLKYAACLKVKK